MSHIIYKSNKIDSKSFYPNHIRVNLIHYLPTSFSHSYPFCFKNYSANEFYTRQRLVSNTLVEMSSANLDRDQSTVLQWRCVTCQPRQRLVSSTLVEICHVPTQTETSQQYLVQWICVTCQPRQRLVNNCSQLQQVLHKSFKSGKDKSCDNTSSQKVKMFPSTKD